MERVAASVDRVDWVRAIERLLYLFPPIVGVGIVGVLQEAEPGVPGLGLAFVLIGTFGYAGITLGVTVAIALDARQVGRHSRRRTPDDGSSEEDHWQGSGGDGDTDDGSDGDHGGTDSTGGTTSTGDTDSTDDTDSCEGDESTDELDDHPDTGDGWRPSPLLNALVALVWAPAAGVVYLARRHRRLGTKAGWSGWWLVVALSLATTLLGAAVGLIAVVLEIPGLFSAAIGLAGAIAFGAFPVAIHQDAAYVAAADGSWRPNPGTYLGLAFVSLFVPPIQPLLAGYYLLRRWRSQNEQSAP